MASKVNKAAALTGTHTAGIFADMTVDGPVIGTLVAIIDRAKNLPNRKKVGKQDPYCAARLGKEASKTKTDIRGGQTPKWDQELRFTVHDSLDYHQLKVSVFNDDKKTEIIGETFINLESVVAPGGGTSDQWHNLQFKGRYAGEIRIELTFYDTRPKDEEPTKVQTPDPVGEENRPLEGLSGPRQPNSVKRRPLPSTPQPSETTPIRPRLPAGPQSSPLPHVPFQPSQQDLTSSPYTAWGPDDLSIYNQNHIRDATPANRDSDPTFFEPQTGQHAPPMPPDNYQSHSNPYPLEHHTQRRDIDELYYPDHNQDYSHSSQAADHDYRHSSEPNVPHVTSRPHIQPTQPILDLPELPPYEPRQRRRAGKPPVGQESQHGSYSSPPGMLPQQRPFSDASSSHHHSYTDYRPSPQTSPIRQIYGSSPLRHQSFEEESDLRSQVDAYEAQEPPPPPPNHRQTERRQSPRPDLQERQQDHVPILRPEPLNFRQTRSSTSQSNSHQNSPRPDAYALPAPSAESVHLPSENRYVPYRSSEPQDYRNSAPVLYNGGHSGSLSIARRYEPSIADDSQSMRGEATSPQHHQAQYQTPPRSRIHTYSTPPVRPLPSNFEHDDPSHNNPSHQARTPQSGPVVRSQAVSPDPRVPSRKAVSPQPSVTHASTIPFGPDSYDSFNPNLNHKSSTNSHNNSPYDTPDRKQPSPQPSPAHDPEEPIIGSDGRVIDPSDHLPTSTWAPEPEKKPPRKGPEITFRFRNAPQGTKPMPNGSPRAPRETTPTTSSARATVRPHSTFMTPTHSFAEPDSPSGGSGPATSGRNRLQKKSRASVIIQPTSSPVAPVPSTPHSADPRYPHRSPDGYSHANSNPATPHHPLREYAGGYNGNGSPAAYAVSRGSPLALEGKGGARLGREDVWSYGGGVGVGVGVDVGDPGYGAQGEGYGPVDLSEEMRRIDIGVGAGGRRAGRGRA